MLMYSGGVAGTSWEDVQKAAGVSASQLYHYFGDKQGLVRAVIAYDTRAILESQQPFLASLDSLEALGHGVISWLRADVKSNAKVAAPWEAWPESCSRHTRSVARTWSTDSTDGKARFEMGCRPCISEVTCAGAPIPTAWPRLCWPPSKAD